MTVDVFRAPDHAGPSSPCTSTRGTSAPGTWPAAARRHSEGFDTMTALDANVLTQLAADLSPADLRFVVRTFDTDMQRLGAALAAAGQAGDAMGWRRAAHSIAGAAAAVGAMRVEQLAREAMERAAIDVAAAVAIQLAATVALTELRNFTDPGGQADERARWMNERVG
jgi:HPt (histidine-containing phosphotransfer) domain-containing protein